LGLNKRLSRIRTEVLVLAGELVLLGTEPLQADKLLMAAEDDDDDEAVNDAIPRSLIKLSICYTQTNR